MATTTQPGGVRPEDRPARNRQSPASLTDFLDAFMWQADPESLRIDFISNGIIDLIGHQASSWVGEADRWSLNILRQDRQRVLECLRATAADGNDREIEFRVRAADGRTLVLRNAVRLLAGRTGKQELWGLATDVTADRRAEERYAALSARAAEFRRRALEDPLTGLPNRILLDDRLGTALRAAERSGEPCAVLMMDLDGFKEINDTQGHQAGDEVLRRVALVLRIALRGQDTPARLGGDEFAAVLPNTGADGASRSSRRIIEALEGIRASIGIAVFPDHGAEAGVLLARADQAMYRTKARGGGWGLFDADTTTPKLGRRRRGFGPARRATIGLAAAVAILSGSMWSTGGRLVARDDSSAKLAIAAAALGSATAEQVAVAVGDVELAVAEISWRDVGAKDVVVALDVLERTLGELKTKAPRGLAARVVDLIATVKQAQAVATVAVNVVPEVDLPTPVPTVPELPDPVPTPGM